MAKKKKTLYDTLGVEPIATKEEIKRAYRKKSKQLHPDINPSPEAEQEFKEVAKAYMILYNDESRYNYDKNGEEELKPKTKPDYDAMAKTMLTKMIYHVVDQIGENLHKRNIKTHLLKEIGSIKQEVSNRLFLSHKTYKAIKLKLEAIDKKFVNIPADSFLYKALDDKRKVVLTQELNPCIQEHKQLITDKRIMIRVEKLIDSQCIDFTEEEIKKNPYADWDSSMNSVSNDPFSSSTSTWLGRQI